MSNPAAGMFLRRPPYAFTEQGVAMLSSVLRSERAVQVNVEIMRTFVKLRRMLASHKELARKLDALEKKYDRQFKVVFDAIRQRVRDTSGGLEWGGMGKRRGKGAADSGEASVATLARAFAGLCPHGQTPRAESIGHSEARFRGVCPCHPPAESVTHPPFPADGLNRLQQLAMQAVQAASP